MFRNCLSPLQTRGGSYLTNRRPLRTGEGGGLLPNLRPRKIWTGNSLVT